MKINKDFIAQDVNTHEETRYIGLMDNENTGVCSGEGEAVSGFSRDFRKQIEDSEGITIFCYEDLPEDIKKFFNKDFLRGNENERYDKRRTATI